MKPLLITFCCLLILGSGAIAASDAPMSTNADTFCAPFDLASLLDGTAGATDRSECPPCTAHEECQDYCSGAGESYCDLSSGICRATADDAPCGICAGDQPTIILNPSGG